VSERVSVGGGGGATFLGSAENIDETLCSAQETLAGTRVRGFGSGLHSCHKR